MILLFNPNDVVLELLIEDLAVSDLVKTINRDGIRIALKSMEISQEDADAILADHLQNRQAKLKQKKIDDKWNTMRAKRTELLRETDFTQLADVPLTQEVKDKYENYRQALRDLPDNIVDIDDFEYPNLEDFLD